MTDHRPFGDLLAYPLRSGVTVAAGSRGAGIKMLNMGELFRYPQIPGVEMARVEVNLADPEKMLLQSGDLMFARRSLTLEGAGKCSIVKEIDEATTWESSIIRARLDPRVAHAPYYFYFFGSPIGRRTVEAIVEQVAAAGIRLSELRNLRVPVPDLAEQRAIAEVLGALDDKIAANTTLADTSFKLASELFDTVSRHLVKQPMSHVLSPILGGTPTRSNGALWGGHNLWASAKDITSASFGVVIDTQEKISDLAVSTTKAKPLPPGSVVLTARGTVGEVARLGVAASFNQSCYGFTPGALSEGVLYFSILSATARAKAIAHGSVFDTITMRTLDYLEIPQFTKPEMVELEQQINPLLKMIEHLVQQNRSLATLRDMLLPQLMSGRIRVKDAEKTVEEVF